MRARSAGRVLATTLIACAATIAVVACGSSSKSGSTSSKTSSSATHSYTVTIDGQTISTDPKLAAEVPASVRKKGVLSDITYNNAPPDESIVGGKLVGWEVDLGNAVAAKLGLKWAPTSSGAFDSFIPGLQNGRFNSSFTSFIQTPARLKEIDIVTYYNVGTGFAVKSGSSLKITTPTDVCGHSIAVIEGSAFIQQTGHRFVLQPLDFDTVPEGAGVTKGIGLAKPIAHAMDSLIASGAYAAIMRKWSIKGPGLVTKATVYSDDGGA